MAKSNKNWISTVYRYKPYLLGGVFALSCATVVGFSQTGLALSSDDPQSCNTTEVHAKARHFSRANFTANAAVITQENGLFWNPMSKSWLSPEQMDLLQLAYDIGFEDGGHRHAELVQAILMQETIAGQLGRMGHMTAPVGKRSYGVMQVKVTAARDVLSENAGLGEFRADEELIVRLLSDDEFNIRIASKYLLQLKERVKTMDRALVAYNVGLGGSSSVEEPGEFKYVVSARGYLDDVVRPFNRRFGDESLRLATVNQGSASPEAARRFPG